MKIESETNQEIETLKPRLSETEKCNQRLQRQYEEVVNDSEVCCKKIKSLETKVWNVKEEKIVTAQLDLNRSWN